MSVLPASRRARAGLVVAALVVAAVAVLVLRRPPGPPGAGDRVVLYGDSLSVEAAPAFTAALERDTEAEVRVRSVPGVAPCDLLGDMQADLADPALRPDVAVIQFAGNNATECIAPTPGEPAPEEERLTGADLAGRYATDVRAAVEAFAAAGTRVVIAGPPPAPGLPGGATDLIEDEYLRIVTEWAGRDIGRVRYADAGATVSEDGEFVDTLPCADGEGAEQGCEDGRIPVRTPDRIHFCPTELTDDLVCPVYSSGAERYADEVARVTTQALDPAY